MSLSSYVARQCVLFIFWLQTLYLLTLLSKLGETEPEPAKPIHLPSAPTAEPVHPTPAGELTFTDLAFLALTLHFTEAEASPTQEERERIPVAA